MKPRRQHSAPAQMTRQYNVTQAFSKIAMAPLHTLTPAMLESISRTHRVPLVDLQRQLAERKQREQREVGHG